MMLEQQRIEFVHLVQRAASTRRSAGATFSHLAEPEADELSERRMGWMSRMGWMISLAC
jgi:hypothetical protein